MDNGTDIAWALTCSQVHQMAGPYTQENHISAQTQILSTDIDTGGSRRRLLQLWVAHEHPRKLYISKDTDTLVCIHNIDIWQIKGEKHGHNDGTGDSRRHKGELYIGFPLTRPLFLRTGNSCIQGS